MAKNYKKTLTACYLGFITQAIAANFAPLLFLTFHHDYNIPLGKIALISGTFFFTQLIVDILCARFADRIGYRKCGIVFGPWPYRACVSAGAFARPFYWNSHKRHCLRHRQRPNRGAVQPYCRGLPL